MLKGISNYISNLRIVSASAIILLASCASQLPKDGQYVDTFTTNPACKPTHLMFEFVSVPDNYWKTRLTESTGKANEILVSDEFAKACQQLTMNKTKGKSVQEVCNELACSDTRTLKFGFFNNKRTSAIAREMGNGVVEFNIAKPDSGAGSPGNIAHEFTHTLGYKHFTNISWLGIFSVPYEVGGLVDELSGKRAD